MCEALNGSHGSSCRHCVYTYTRYGRYGWLLKTAARVVCAVFVCRSADSRRPVRTRRGAIVDSLFILIPEYRNIRPIWGGKYAFRREQTMTYKSKKYDVAATWDRYAQAPGGAGRSNARLDDDLDRLR